MANPVELGAASGQKLDTILQRLRQSKDITPHLQQVLDVANRCHHCEATWPENILQMDTCEPGNSINPSPVFAKIV